MGALSNPFDVLPVNLFNLFSSQAGELQRHYVAVLLRIYELAEFNRLGLTREIVVAEIVDYINGAGQGLKVEDEDEELGSDDVQARERVLLAAAPAMQTLGRVVGVGGRGRAGA
jgi:hypothetical protein